MMFLMSLMIITNTIFVYMTHPLSLGLMLIIQTIIIAFFSSLFMPSFWYSYILVLVFMGGLLVLFVYVATLASNEQMNISPSYMLMILSAMAALFFFYNFSHSKAFTMTDNFHNDYAFSWMFSVPFFSMSSFLIIYLFIVLVAVVKITKFWGGSLRPKS